jgi:hypothetical protein
VIRLSVHIQRDSEWISTTDSHDLVGLVIRIVVVSACSALRIEHAFVSTATLLGRGTGGAHGRAPGRASGRATGRATGRASSGSSSGLPSDVGRARSGLHIITLDFGRVWYNNNDNTNNDKKIFRCAELCIEEIRAFLCQIPSTAMISKTFKHAHTSQLLSPPPLIPSSFVNSHVHLNIDLRRNIGVRHLFCICLNAWNLSPSHSRSLCLFQVSVQVSVRGLFEIIIFLDLNFKCVVVCCFDEYYTSSHSLLIVAQIQPPHPPSEEWSVDVS